MVILLLGLLFILNTTALTFFGLTYCSGNTNLMRYVLSLTAINILLNAISFAVLYQT